jgi:transcriptional antiterminator RfaH
MQDWYLVRTKTGAERVANAQLQPIVDRVLLPLAKVQVRQRDHTYQRISPIFPSYLFASFSLGRMARQIRYTPGVRSIVQFGESAAVVPICVIDELIARCADGPVDLSPPRLPPGAPVQVTYGPFREFSAIFEGYCRGGSERVAVLLKVMNAERRVEMPVNMVSQSETPRVRAHVT